MSRAGPVLNRRRRTGALVLTALLLALVLLGIGLVVADGYVERRVEHQAGTDLQRQLGTPEPPTVDVLGRPFLTQVVSGTIGSAHVTARDVGATTGARLRIAEAALTVTDVTSEDWFAHLRVSHAEGTARLDWAALQPLAGAPLEYAGDGAVRLSYTPEIFGQRVTVRVTGRPALQAADQTLTLTDPRIDLAGVALSDFAARALVRTLVKPIPLTGLPLGLRLESVTAAEDGVHAGVVGEGLELTR